MIAVQTLSCQFQFHPIGLSKSQLRSSKSKHLRLDHSSAIVKYQYLCCSVAKHSWHPLSEAFRRLQEAYSQAKKPFVKAK